MKPANNDIIGQAGLDYLLAGNRNKTIKVWCSIAETDLLPVHYLFRSYSEMPKLEQKAIMNCRGRILDVGAGMGPHSIYLQNKGYDVMALEASGLACEVMARLGVKNILNQDFFEFKDQNRFDTILMMMNGIGLVGKINRFPLFFKKAEELLRPGGQILLDSSDLRYLFMDDDGSFMVNLNEDYYGEVKYKMSYDKMEGKPFPWLFIDDELMAYYAGQNGFKFEKLANGLHYDYLARLCK